MKKCPSCSISTIPPLRLALEPVAGPIKCANCEVLVTKEPSLVRDFAAMSPMFIYLGVMAFLPDEWRPFSYAILILAFCISFALAMLLAEPRVLVKKVMNKEPV